MNIPQPKRRTLLIGVGAVMGAGLGACATSEPAPPQAPQSPRDRIREAIRQKRESQQSGGNASVGDLQTDRLSDPRALPGRYSVKRIEAVWNDPARGNRAVPWRAYAPIGLKGPAPVVIHSHGGGGSRETASQYGEHLASHGFLALHLQHLGSDRDAFRADPQQISAAARDPKLGAVRFEDVGFAWRQLQSAAGREPLDALDAVVDPSLVGIAGHSFGAITAQIIAGQFVNGFEQRLAIPQMKGAFALSPSPPRPDYADVNTCFRAMKMPIFHATGTEDDAPNGDFQAPARRIPFDRINNVDQYLMILKGANHFSFGGELNPQLRGQSFGYPALPRHHDLIRAAMIAFWGSTLRSDAAETKYLRDGAFRTLVGQGDVFETKSAR